MKYAVVSDEVYPVNEVVVALLEDKGHQVERFGSLKSGQAEGYAEVALEAAHAVARGHCDEGVFFCWTGTGISITANKIAGIRAALCCDAETARGARIWNHANVLALSNRWVSADLAKEILEAWLDTPADDSRAADQVRLITEAEER